MPSTAYADWKAPKRDTDLLIWPNGPRLREAALQSGEFLRASTTPILGIPLAEARQAMRAYLGHHTEVPLYVTGHQTELHHPGVWMKNAVIHHLAATSGDGARAMHLAVDTDQPKHLVLRYPTSREGFTPPASMPITDDPELTHAAWAGRLSGPSPAHALELERTFARDAIAFDFEPAAGDVLASLRRASLEEGVLPRMLVSALHELDWSLGLKYDAVMASPLWESDAFLLLASHLIASAGPYAQAYNAALADYRQEEGIDNPGRPMPDLNISADAVELPLWCDDQDSGHRARPHARFKEGHPTLYLRGEPFTPNPAGGWETVRELRDFLRRHNHRLAPRALTLTTFARLFFADLFLHGIGGGRYDQVTDRTLRSFFSIEPPLFAVATGTLYFPWAQNRSRACVPCVKHEGHRLKHAVLGDRKSRYLEAISASPRHSSQRKQAFLEMHQLLSAEQPASPVLSAWKDRLDETLRSAAQDTLVFDRELFYALQPRTRLVSWIDQVSEALGR